MDRDSVLDILGAFADENYTDFLEGLGEINIGNPDLPPALGDENFDNFLEGLGEINFENPDPPPTADSNTSNTTSESELADILSDNSFRTSILANPLHVNSTRQHTYGGDVEKAGYTLSTTRGERNLTGVYRETDEETDRILEETLRYVHKKAYEQLVEQDADLSEPGKAALMLDSKTPVPEFHMKAQSSGVYELNGDMTFNIHPKRSQLLAHLYDLTKGDPCQTELEIMLDNLGSILDLQCENGSACLYSTYFFPGVSVPAGPIAYGREKELLITMEPQKVGDSGSLYHLIEGAHNLYKDLSTNKLCICCLLVEQASNQFDVSSGGRSDRIDRPMQANDVFFIARTYVCRARKQREKIHRSACVVSVGAIISSGTHQDHFTLFLQLESFEFLPYLLFS